mmetsp:Transcript_26221/g.36952  ORF Transcript_26221/g.36952 Transcript_26221/m.36952 type:complete len:203 (+) Transcript_26221:95-703(+)
MILKLKEILRSLQAYFSAIEIDSGIKQAYQIGLVIGLLIATTLTFFPGEPWGIKYGMNDSEESPSDHNREDENTPQSHDGEKDDASPSRQQQRGMHQMKWAGDAIPKEKLEKLRVKLGLTEEQMQQAIDDARHEAITGERRQLDGTISNTGIRTLFEKINSAVYILIIVAIFYILNYQYKNVVTRFLIRVFPKEAKMIGVTP